MYTKEFAKKQIKDCKNLLKKCNKNGVYRGMNVKVLLNNWEVFYNNSNKQSLAKAERIKREIKEELEYNLYNDNFILL